MLIKRILIVDLSNLFLRSYIVDPSLSLNGVPIGGLVGSLKSTQKIVRETKPDQIVIAWDGPGGSRRRREKNKNYKSGRKPLRLNRFIKNEVSEAADEHNRVYQMTRLWEYFEHMPVYQMIFEGVEADDVIAHITQLQQLKKSQKIIVSSDKDFIQLLDDKTLLYRPAQKEVLNVVRVVKQYGIHPNNFVLARSCCGSADKSDGLAGAKGVGLKGVAKRFTALSRKEPLSLDYIFNECKKEVEKETKIKLYQKILDSKKVIRQNYSLMQLFNPKMSVQDKRDCKKMLQENHSNLNQTELLKMMVHDNIGSWNWDGLYARFNKILLEQKQRGEKIND